MVVPIDYEAHLMVTDPLEWFRPLVGTRMTRCIFHIEPLDDPAAVAEEIINAGIVPGAALNPDTAVEKAADCLPLLGVVLVMTVTPGFYGSPFIPEALGKAAEIKRLAPHVTVGIDGGVSMDNLDLAREAGVDYVCVGSRVVLADDPASSFAAFSKKAS